MSLPSPSLPPSRHSGSLSVPRIDVGELLNKKIETGLSGSIDKLRSGSEVEEDFKRLAYESIYVKTLELKSAIEGKGYAVSMQYCASALHEHPVPVMTIQARDGKYGVVSSNLWWDPVVPLDYQSGPAPQGEKSVISSDQAHEERCSLNDSWSLTSTALHVELFSKDAPVRMAIVQSDSPNTPAQMVPVFSDKALREARGHAAHVLKSGDGTVYSYVFHELIVPQARERIRESYILFGERDTPSFRDNGGPVDGASFNFAALYQDEQEEVSLRGAIVESGCRSSLPRLQWRDI